MTDPISNPDYGIPSFGELSRQLVEELKSYFDAERHVYGVQARLSRRAAETMALYALGAVVVAQGGMIALVVGILLTLAPLVGPLWATLIIVLVCAVATYIFIALIRSKLRFVRSAWRRRHDA